jgi:phosphoglycolate phosphatase-like HAD superfamily hydrolase
MNKDYEAYRAFLEIDDHDLDGCLMQQPEAYHYASEQHVFAVARHDEAKLILEETTAELDQDVRARAAKANEKLTEGAIEARLTGLPKIKELTRALLNAKKEAATWAALKDSFSQRSHALRDLVALRLGERRDLAMEAGSGQLRGSLTAYKSEEVRAATAEIRRQQRGAK